jgi:hypothetical protein
MGNHEARKEEKIQNPARYFTPFAKKARGEGDEVGSFWHPDAGLED